VAGFEAASSHHGEIGREHISMVIAWLFDKSLSLLVVPDNDLYNNLKRTFLGHQLPTKDLMKEFLGNFLVLTLNSGLTPSSHEDKNKIKGEDEDKNKIKGVNFNEKEALFEISDRTKCSLNSKRTSVQFLSNGYKLRDFYFN